MAKPPEFTAVLTNERAFTALRVVGRTLIDLHEDLPWRSEELGRAVRALQYALEHLEFVELDGETDE